MTERNRWFAVALAGSPAALVIMANTAVAQVPVQIEVTLDGVRNERGLLRLCLTRDARHFPDCARDPAAVTATVRAGVRVVRLIAPASGEYALSVLHDANGNGRADTVLGVPREGFGFSRNPVIRFGPPRFADTVVQVGPGLSRQTVRMRYLL